MISTPFFAPLIYAKDEGGLHDAVSLHRCQHMRMRAGTLFIYCMPSARCVPATVLFDFLYNIFICARNDWWRPLRSDYCTRQILLSHHLLIPGFILDNKKAGEKIIFSLPL